MGEAGEGLKALGPIDQDGRVLSQPRVRKVATSIVITAGIKLSSVATNITGVSGRAMLEALIAGERDPEVLADLAKQRLRNKLPALTEALTGRFTDHHAFLARTYLNLIDQHTAAIEDINARIEVVIAPFAPIRDLLISIPRVSITVADVIIAETGGDISVFPTAGHLASWAGTCPGVQRIRRPSQIHPHQTRKPLPQRRP